MEQIYIFMLFVLLVLAVFDLMVGVSNDAVNFVNSAIGSKVASFRTVMIVASLGIALGAMFSGGMMEIAKTGIFNPEKFYFEEVMYIFVAVMLTDILLMDFFNSLGLPTSTTVSVVFEILGSAVAMAVMKVIEPTSTDTIANLLDYINTAKAVEVITGIFVSVGIAFVVGSVVQYISRLIFTFNYERKMKYLSGIFGGISLAALSYFLIIKGLEGVSFISKVQKMWIDENALLLLLIFFVFFSVISQILHSFRVNIFKIIILTGTFALAMAFAGNDMVNFIGIPIAAFDSFTIWQKAGSPESGFTMEGLRSMNQPASSFLIVGAGIVMILTLWFSKKARNVIETGVNLSRQDEGGNEKFEANALSRLIVRTAVGTSYLIDKVIPKGIRDVIDERFQKPEENKLVKADDKPAFDLVRASVNLVIASSLISFGTSMKLPLSTTYVTFMVAMGSSLADRAWGRESAVFRVAGVLNVVGGWFLTAGAAFIMAFAVTTLLFFGELYALIALVFVVFSLLIRSSIVFKNKMKAQAEVQQQRSFDRSDLITIKEIVRISSQNIAKAVKKIDNLYVRTIDNLAVENLVELKVCKKKTKALEADIEELKSEIYYFIKSLDDSSIASSKFYILILDYLHSMSQSLGFITEISYTHTNNNHKKLKYNQIRDLKIISEKIHNQFQIILEILKVSMYAASTTKLIEEENKIKNDISALIEKQIKEIRSSDSSPKNTKLYFSILLETKVLIRTTISLMSLFKDFKDQYKNIDTAQ